MIGDASLEEGVSVSPFFQRMRHVSLRRSNQQVERHLDLARQLAVHYSRRTGYDQDDLRQVGLIGLIKASRSYQATTNVPFEVYARPHIRGEILHYLRDGVALVRLPRRVEEEAARLARRQSEPLDSREQMILDQYRSKSAWQQLDTVSDVQTVDHLHQLDQRESRQRVRQTLQALPTPERKAVVATVLEGLSLREAGRRHRVSAMTVQRRLKRGLSQMACCLEQDQLSV